MQKLQIQGGNRLNGELVVQGAKNSSLPVLAATVLCRGESVICNCPNLLDTNLTLEILEHLGCHCRREGNAVTVDALQVNKSEVPQSLMREARSSIVFLGAIAARCTTCRLCYPGGCEIGQRPIDLHLSALQKMGLCIAEDHGYLDCTLPGGRFTGTNILLSFPSVGATENIMLAAVLARGVTVITNAAQEPEIVDLAAFLTSCGARIAGAGEGTVRIEGVPELHACTHRVIPDRIVAATFLAGAAMTGGSIYLNGLSGDFMGAILPLFEGAGCTVQRYHTGLCLSAQRPLSAVSLVRTMPYPGFPTDAQAPLMAMMSVAAGTSVFVENIFENRYKHAAELQRMGAKIKVEGRVAVVEGVKELHSAPVCAADLRGGAALVLAGLAAQGTTELYGVRHIDRGYEQLEEKLSQLGAHIERLQTKEEQSF